MGERLTAKVGPLPVWAWGLLIGALIVAYVWISKARGGSAAASPSASSDGGDAAATRDGLVTGWRDSSGIPAGAIGVNTGNVNTDTTTSTNQYWKTQAVAWAQNNGFTPVNASIALDKYLNGQDLSPTDTSVVNAVLAKFGLPPEGLFGTSQAEPITTRAQRAAYYARKAGTSAVYAVYPDGSREWLTRAGWLALGSPAWQDVPATDPLWQGPVIGLDAPVNER